MNLHLVAILLLAGIVLSVCFCTRPEPENQTEAIKITSALDFQKQVETAGGRVDFVFGEDRPFKECHASSIVETADGKLLCAFFAGTKEKDADVGIWIAKFENGTWGQLETKIKVMNRAHWNPVLFRDAENVVHLFFKVGVDVPAWQTYLTSSTDNGATWSDPIELVPGDIGGRGPVKNPPIILADGAWLAPASTEKPNDGDWDPFADRSTDRGKTWTRSENWYIDRKNENFQGQGAIQPTFWESVPGKVHALMRTCNGKIWRADSEDGGRTWSAVQTTALPNNNSGIDLQKLADGRLLLVYNPVDINWGPRTPLDLAVSADNGKTWKTIAHLEDDPNQDAEYSYPTIVRKATGVAISYTWNRKLVRCWQIPLEAIQ